MNNAVKELIEAIRLQNEADIRINEDSKTIVILKSPIISPIILSEKIGGILEAFSSYTDYYTIERRVK